jgi:sugar (pentulose or hexulose) kinase
VVVLDVGKTLSKASLWAPDGALVARRERPNSRVQGPGYVALDVHGIEDWFARALTEFGRLAPVAAIVPVAHGAAMAVVRDGCLLLPPMDYESPIPEPERSRYDAGRDPFAATGSPALPDGLNVGAQLHWLEVLHPQCLRPGAVLLPWAQYWAWRLSGVATSEVTSLGCHTDLWLPASGRPSALAERRGWAALLAPLRRASDCLGNLSSDWVARTGLPAGVEIYCGLHDSNAALLAGRGLPGLKGVELTILSTGTWFVAMRTPTEAIEPAALPDGRDCLMNVDALGKPVPSARFMGGREIEMLTGIDTRRVDNAQDQPALLAAVPQALAGGACVLPTFAAGCGPFPHAVGRWVHKPAGDAPLRAMACLYAALVADVSLDLIGASGQLVVEGRFAQAQVFVRALATLRPRMAIHVCDAGNDASSGPLRLLDPGLALSGSLTRVEGLAVNLDQLREQWRAEAGKMELHS